MGNAVPEWRKWHFLCTCFQHNFVQECTKISKIVHNEQPLSLEKNCITPKKINWETFNPPEAEGEGVSPVGSSSCVCNLQPGLLGDGAQPPMWENHHLGHLLLACRALRRQTGLARSCKSAFRHPLNTWDLQELRTSFNTQGFFVCHVYAWWACAKDPITIFLSLSPLSSPLPPPIIRDTWKNKELFVWFLLLLLIFWRIWCCESRAVRDPLSSVCNGREEFSLVWGR